MSSAASQAVEVLTPSSSSPAAQLATVQLEAADAARVAEARTHSRSERTRAEYRRAWGAFARWAVERGYHPLPAAPGTVAAYLAARAEDGRSVSTLSVDLAAISEAHKVLGHQSPRLSPEFSEAWKGIKRSVGQSRGARPNQKAPVTASDVAAMVRATCPDTLGGLRDRALLAVGFAGAFRRSELAALEVADVEAVPGRGLRVHVRRSKTDQLGEGQVKTLPYGSGEACPVRALEAWLAAAGLEAGPVFRPINRHGQLGPRAITGHSVAAVVKAAAARVGLEPARVSGHSLRAGYVTSQLEAGVGSLTIRRQTGHRSDRILAAYDRRRDVWTPCGL